MKYVLCLLLISTLATPCIADSIVYMRVPRPLIEEHLKLAQDAEAQRVTTLRNLFQKAGCPQIVEQTVPEESSPNLICILPGIEEGTIVVGASLDYVPDEAKNPAHWSALALLPLLAKSLAAVPHRSTLMLAAFPGHTRGLRGAMSYVSRLTEVQRSTVRAMVDLDNLGQTPPVYALAQSDKTLATWLQAAAHSLKLASPPMLDASTAGPSKNDPPKDGSAAIKDEDLWADAKPFEQARIPAITVQSAPSAMLPALKRDGATPDRITGTGFDMDAYDDTYRLLCVYLLYLDGNLGRPPIKPGTYSGSLLDTAGHFGSRVINMSVQIDRYTTMADLNRFEKILKKGGQEALADALEGENDKGIYRVAVRLGTGIKMIIPQNSGKTPSVLLVAVRLKRRATISSDDYRFDAIQLNLDSKGEGDGLYSDSVKLRFNSKHELEIEDRRYQSDEIRQVRLEPPSVPKTTSKVD